mgnify:CR=1 FL=1
MTAKEKASDLYSKFDNLLNKDFIHPIVYDNQLKKCALIAVDEILNYQSKLLENYKFKIENSFYEQVKQEIEKL